MNISDRIQSLRKAKGISQEELADKIGVSRQAVSKWESEQSTPDLDKIITLSEYFDVTTDYILKGIENPKEIAERNKNSSTSHILFIGSTAFIAIGLLCAFGGWYAEQSAESIWGSMIIQVIGVAGYAIGKLLSRAKAPLIINWLNICLALFMPLSLLVALIMGRVASPYPADIISIAVFAVTYVLIGAVVFAVLKKKSTQ